MPVFRPFLPQANPKPDEPEPEPEPQMSFAATDCPICLEPFDAENPAAGPSLDDAPGTCCPHYLCEPCGERLAQGAPPFRCPICRDDYTAWFVDHFCWTPAEGTYITMAMVRVFIRTITNRLEQQGGGSVEQLIRTGDRLLCQDMPEQLAEIRAFVQTTVNMLEQQGGPAELLRTGDLILEHLLPPSPR